MSTEATHLIATVLHDFTRMPAPPHLRRKLERRYLGRGTRRWLVPSFSAVAGAAMAAIVLLLVRPAHAPAADPATEAVGDHMRVLGERGLGVITNDMHNVKPWFAGKLDFVPPVTFLGDDEFQLRGGDVAVFLGHKAAAFVYGRRLHTISLFVFESSDIATRERTIQGFHVLTWSDAGFGFSLVSDVNWDDLHTLHDRLR
jgi:anti-sigma factor RsiW